MRLECRECEVICERVVLPWHCLRAGRTCVYAYEDGESTYFGCLHKVFSPELDLAVFNDAGVHTGRRSDPYGALRVARIPRPQCPVDIEQAYCAHSAQDLCVNPGFHIDAVVERPRVKEGRGGPGRDDGSESAT